MIGEIVKAILEECAAFLLDKGGTYILKTNFKAKDLGNYTMPLILADIIDAAETGQYPGGLTMVDWQLALNSYNYEPDNTNDDPTDYSANLLNVIDDIRRHFTNAEWLTDGMIDILNNYGFRFTLNGIHTADALPEEDGLIIGYKIIFDSISFDPETSTITDSTSTLEHVNQVNNPPFN